MLESTGNNGETKTHKGIENLVPFAKGFDPKRNLSGRPRKITDRVEKYLKAKGPDGERNLDRLAKAAVERAISRSDTALSEIWNRVEGPLPRAQEAPQLVIVMSAEEMNRAASILDRMRVIDVSPKELEEDESL